MNNRDWTLKSLLLLIVLLLGVIAFRSPLVETAYAQTAKFDHVNVVSTLFLYQGERGLLLLDKRNGNVWFMPQRGGAYADPEFLLRVPFEQLDNQPR